MIFEGIPWPLVLPLAVLALTAGIISAKKEIERNKKQRSAKKKYL